LDLTDSKKWIFSFGPYGQQKNGFLFLDLTDIKKFNFGLYWPQKMDF
jgi:hypothetical protein